jgi:TRAP-type C4-dicarboxylate transport system permease small subunit
MTPARWYWLGAVVLLAAWVVLAFVVAVPSGWVHAPLAIGTVLIAMAIVESG